MDYLGKYTDGCSLALLQNMFLCLDEMQWWLVGDVPQALVLGRFFRFFIFCTILYIYLITHFNRDL